MGHIHFNRSFSTHLASSSLYSPWGTQHADIPLMELNAIFSGQLSPPYALTKTELLLLLIITKLTKSELFIIILINKYIF